jgi:hypothetical protein
MTSVIEKNGDFRLFQCKFEQKSPKNCKKSPKFWNHIILKTNVFQICDICGLAIFNERS